MILGIDTSAAQCAVAPLGAPINAGDPVVERRAIERGHDEPEIAPVEAPTINKNREVARRVRQTMIDSGSPSPERLPSAEEPIKEVEKRVKRKELSGPTA